MGRYGEICTFSAADAHCTAAAQPGVVGAMGVVGLGGGVVGLRVGVGLVGVGVGVVGALPWRPEPASGVALCPLITPRSRCASWREYRG